MNIEYLKSTGANGLEINRLSQSAEKSAKSTGEAAKDGQPKDKLSISQEAKILHRTDTVVRSKLNELPDIREDRIRAVKERLNSGFYLSDECMEETASAVVNESSKSSRRFEESTIKILLNKLDEIPEVRDAEISRAAERKDRNFYNNEETMNKTAERIWMPPQYRK